jgi:restriction system protein
MIPDYQSFMLPLLKLASDGREHRISDVIVALAKELGVGDADIAAMLPSGRQRVFYNRVHWAKTYLSQAKLLQSTRRAHFRITERGREVLAENPNRIDVRMLERFPEFAEFKNRTRQPAETAPSSSALPDVADNSTLESATPDELLRTTIAGIESALASELLDRILAAPPAFFESLIVALLLGMGYGGSRQEAGRALGKRAMAASMV